MAFNLFVAYDLMSPGQNYDAVRDKIRSLGVTWQFQYSLFYLNTNLAPQLVFEQLTSVMDGNDRLAVIVAAGELGAIVTNWDHPPINEINTIWTGA